MLEDIKTEAARRKAEEDAALAKLDNALSVAYWNYERLIADFCRESGWVLEGPTYGGPTQTTGRQLSVRIAPPGETRYTRQFRLDIAIFPAVFFMKERLLHDVGHTSHWDQFGNAAYRIEKWEDVNVPKLQDLLRSCYRAVVNAPAEDRHSSY